jgi:hypothetical protein
MQSPPPQLVFSTVEVVIPPHVPKSQLAGFLEGLLHADASPGETPFGAAHLAETLRKRRPAYERTVGATGPETIVRVDITLVRGT